VPKSRELLDLPIGESAAIAEVGLQREPVFTAPELSIIVPTFNECENVPVLVDRVRKALPGVAWEMIIVDDDSPGRNCGRGAHDRRQRRAHPLPAPGWPARIVRRLPGGHAG